MVGGPSMRNSERETAAIHVVEAPSLDQIFDLLSNRRRRYALYYLRQVADGVATVDEVVDHVVSFQDDVEPTDEYRLSVRNSFRHVHLPKLNDAGVLEYDARSDAIRYWGQPSLDEWLEHALQKER